MAYVLDTAKNAKRLKWSSWVIYDQNFCQEMADKGETNWAKIDPGIYVGDRTSILYRTRMVHTIRVYAYGMTVRVWYGYLYHMRIATIVTILLLLFTSSTSI